MNPLRRYARAAAFLLALGLGIGGLPATRAQDSVTDQPQLPQDAKLIADPDALRALLTDRTVHATYLPDGSNWREFSASDGRTIWDEGTCIRPGTWRISGSVVCYTYPSWDDGRPQCFVVYRSAAATHFVVLDSVTGERYLVSNAYEILDGNTDNLPLDATKPLCDDVNA